MKLGISENKLKKEIESELQRLNIDKDQINGDDIEGLMLYLNNKIDHLQIYGYTHCFDIEYKSIRITLDNNDYLSKKLFLFFDNNNIIY